MMHLGLKLVSTPLLPVRKTITLCDIETKMEFQMDTNEWIHAIKTGNTLMVSSEAYKQFEDRAQHYRESF